MHPKTGIINGQKSFLRSKYGEVFPLFQRYRSFESYDESPSRLTSFNFCFIAFEIIDIHGVKESSSLTKIEMGLSPSSIRDISALR